jgi:hypothetical protein
VFVQPLACADAERETATRQQCGGRGGLWKWSLTSTKSKPVSSALVACSTISVGEYASAINLNPIRTSCLLWCPPTGTPRCFGATRDRHLARAARRCARSRFTAGAVGTGSR